MTFQKGEAVRFKVQPSLKGIVEDFSAKGDFDFLREKISEEEFKKVGYAVVRFDKLDTAVIVSSDSLEHVPDVCPSEYSLLILRILKDKGMRANDVLQMRIFWSYQDGRNVRADDLNKGLEEAEKNRWTEATSSGAIKLTKAGYAAMQEHNI